MSTKSPFIRRALGAAGLVAVVGGSLIATSPAHADALPICSLTTDNPVVSGTNVVFHARLDCDQPALVAYQIRLQRTSGGAVAQSQGIPTKTNAVTNATLSAACSTGAWQGNVTFYVGNATVTYYGQGNSNITSC